MQYEHTPILEPTRKESLELKEGKMEGMSYSVRNRKCQRMSTKACTIAEAKIEPVLRHVERSEEKDCNGKWEEAFPF